MSIFRGEPYLPRRPKKCKIKNAEEIENMKISLEEELWKNIDNKSDSECWNWKGRKNNSGYGIYSYKGVPLIAHREIYRMKYGDIPERLLVRHKCDNPPCCNPNHLELGTNADNMNDKAVRNNYYRLLFGGHR